MKFIAMAADQQQAAFRVCAQPPLRSAKTVALTVACGRSPRPRMVLRLPRQVPIENVRVGDRVQSGPRSQGPSVRPVVRLFRRGPQSVVAVSVCGPEGAETIVSTPMHPFWVVGKGWTPASVLQQDDLLWTRCDEHAQVVGVKPSGHEPIFNLEVAQAHSYFVGKAGVLVHNESLNPDHLKVWGADRTWHDEGTYVEYERDGRWRGGRILRIVDNEHSTGVDVEEVRSSAHESLIHHERLSPAEQATMRASPAARSLFDRTREAGLNAFAGSLLERTLDVRFKRFEERAARWQPLPSGVIRGIVSTTSLAPTTAVAQTTLDMVGRLASARRVLAWTRRHAVDVAARMFVDAHPYVRKLATDGMLHPAVHFLVLKQRSAESPYGGNIRVFRDEYKIDEFQRELGHAELPFDRRFFGIHGPDTHWMQLLMASESGDLALPTRAYDPMAPEALKFIASTVNQIDPSAPNGIFGAAFDAQVEKYSGAHRPESLNPDIFMNLPWMRLARIRDAHIVWDPRPLSVFHPDWSLGQ